MRFISDFLRRHPSLDLFMQKVMRDNITFLASAVAWTLLTSVVPIVVGLMAISNLFLRDPASQRAVVDHLSRGRALHGDGGRSGWTEPVIQEKR